MHYINFRIFASLPLLLILTYAINVEGKMKYYTLVEKTRGSDVIFLGEVLESADPHSAILVAHSSMKGIVEGNVEISFSKNSTYLQQGTEIKLTVKDQVLVFANYEDDKLTTFHGLQGILVLKSGWDDQYKEVVSKIIDFDAAEDNEVRTEVLKQMLKGKSYLTQDAALEIIYLQYHSRLFDTDQLVEPVIGLIENKIPSISGYALQVISRIVNKESIAHLIQLLGSDDQKKAEDVYKVLVGATRSTLQYEWSADKQKRDTQIKEWNIWWKSNKDKINLVL